VITSPLMFICIHAMIQERLIEFPLNLASTLCH
jgi:hypothetical protein